MKALLALCMGLALATSTWAGVTVSKVSGTVTIHREASEPIPVTAPMPVNDGDELIGESDDASVELNCAADATQALSDRFDAVINSGQAKTTCAVDLNAGTAVATVAPGSPGDSKDDPSIQGGPYAMLAHHTQFGLSIVRNQPEEADAFVIEGTATVERKTDQSPITLTDGQRFDYKTAAVKPIPAATYARVARTYARLDVSQLGANAPPGAQAQLTSKWYAALRKPNDAAAREALTQSYVAYNLNETATAKYQVWRSAQIKQKAVYVGPPPLEPAVVYRPKPQVRAGQKYAVHPPQKTFNNPQVGNERLDYCLHWGAACGQPAVDEFCRQQNYARATAFMPAWDIGAQTPTRVIGDNAVCSDAGCDGFTSVTCSD